MHSNREEESKTKSCEGERLTCLQCKRQGQSFKFYAMSIIIPGDDSLSGLGALRVESGLPGGVLLDRFMIAPAQECLLIYL